MRAAKICVLPVPGPAITKTGPSICSTAFLCDEFKSANAFKNCSLCLMVSLFMMRLLLWY